jgi:hypothetical protein
LSSTGLTGAGSAYLNVVATNASGNSVTTPVTVIWKAWTSAVPNVIAAPVHLLAPAGTSLAAGRIIGRLGIDTSAGACWNTSANSSCTPNPSCAITGGSGSVSSFQVVASSWGYHCIIEANTTITASTSATLTITATNKNGTGSAASIPVSVTIQPSGTPVVSQTNLTLLTPAAKNAIVGTVPATNTPSSCTIFGGDPGNPGGDSGPPAAAYFAIAPVSGGCQITTNQALSGSLGSPILYVIAANGLGTGMGNYVVVGMGPTVTSWPSYVPGSTLSSLGYNRLIINDTSMVNAQIDFTNSGLPSPTIHWYSSGANFASQPLCDTGSSFGTSYACDYADGPSLFDAQPKDQAGDTLTSPRVSVANGVLTVSTTNGANTLLSCGQFGNEPWNNIYPVIGHAYAGAYYMDFVVDLPANPTPSSHFGGLWQLPLQLWVNPLSSPQGSHAQEWDLVQNIYGMYLEDYTSNANGYAYNSATAVAAMQSNGAPYPTDGASHHYGVLVEPSAIHGSSQGLVTMYVDGVAKGTSVYSTGGANSGTDTQQGCVYIGYGIQGSAPAQHISSFQVWQHP